MDWNQLLQGVNTSVQNVANVWSNVQNTRTAIASQKAQAEIDRATVDANKQILLAQATQAKAVQVAPAMPALPSTVVNTSTGMSPRTLLLAGLGIAGLFYFMTRKGAA